MHKMRKRICK